MPIKEALKILAEHPLSPEDAATRPGLFKGTEYVVEERLERAAPAANNDPGRTATDGDVERSKRSVAP